MPKKLPIVDKRKWLEDYESGKSEALIARENHKDLRVIKRGINEARLERSGMIAQSEVVKEALVRHQNQLLSLIDRLQAALVLPGSNLEIRHEKDGTLAPISLGVAVIRENPRGNIYVEMTEENTALWRLLREHLKHETLWKNLEQWKSAMVNHVKSRIHVEEKLVELLEKNTGLQVLERQPEDKDIHYINYHHTVKLFSRVAINKILDIPDETYPEKNIVISDDGYLRNGKGGPEIAYCPGKEKPSYDGILTAFTELQNSQEIMSVKSTNSKLSSILMKLQQTLEDIQLMGMVPNACRICRKLVR